jgi:hypothetical protein
MFENLLRPTNVLSAMLTSRLDETWLRIDYRRESKRERSSLSLGWVLCVVIKRRTHALLPTVCSCSSAITHRHTPNQTNPTLN